MHRILHIITGLNGGGAENMLFKLLKYSNKERYYHEVISLMDKGIYGEKIQELGVKVHCLRISKRNMVSALINARNICKGFDIINTWLYHADIFGFIVAKILLNKKLIWNIRHSNLEKEANKPRTLKIIKINSFLSKYVDCITYNSNKALENHIKFGYVDKNSVVIPNGFELDKFKFDLENRIRIRKELELDEEQKVIITVGRWDVQKDYYTLLKALNELKKHNNNFKMIMCGTNLDYSNKELTDLIDKYELRENIILLGRREDIPALLSAADIYVSSSLGESFSNAIGEAMACELPCVVTDVGDSKIIVGDTGKVVEAKNYINLSSSILSCLNDSHLEEIGKKARLRIIRNYDIKTIVKLYEANFFN
ncbi:glycosyltransferase [Caloranaerobacter sp. DY30410]|uniref:glycosyltransferase n=1 Tax=Caloranaerobacter sp. DY30410 TaxID=3238305 RepID=UPI003D017A00